MRIGHLVALSKDLIHELGIICFLCSEYIQRSEHWRLGVNSREFLIGSHIDGVAEYLGGVLLPPKFLKAWTPVGLRVGHQRIVFEPESLRMSLVGQIYLMASRDVERIPLVR